MTPGIHHLVHHNVQIVNGWPTGITVVLAILALVIFFFSFVEEDGKMFLTSLLVAGLIAIPGLGWGYHHSEKGTPIPFLLVNTGKYKVWVPAHRLTNGDWWPDGGYRVRNK